MVVVIGREVFHNGDVGVDAVRCPLCGANQVKSDWGEAIDRWSDGDDDALLMCNACSAVSPLTRWLFEPAWDLGVLASRSETGRRSIRNSSSRFPRYCRRKC